MSTVRRGCSVATCFTTEETARLEALEHRAQQLEAMAWCGLSPEHPGRWHYGLAQDTPDGHWWLRWDDEGARELLLLAKECQLEDPEYPIGPSGAPEPCTLPGMHEAAHGFEFNIGLDASGPQQAHLLVGQLRQVLAEWPDDSRLEIRSGEYPALVCGGDVGVQGVGRGNVRTGTLDSRVPAFIPAAVLLIGYSWGPKPHLLAGQLREVLAAWPDTAPIRLGAFRRGILSEEDEALVTAVDPHDSRTPSWDPGADAPKAVVVRTERARGRHQQPGAGYPQYPDAVDVLESIHDYYSTLRIRGAVVGDFTEQQRRLFKRDGDACEAALRRMRGGEDRESDGEVLARWIARFRDLPVLVDPATGKLKWL